MPILMRFAFAFLAIFPCLSKAQTGAAFSANRCESLFSGAVDRTDFQYRLATLPYRHTPEDLLQISKQAQTLFDNAGIRYQEGPPESLRFVFSTNGSHPINRFAASMKEKMQVDVVYSLSDLIVDGILVKGAYIRSQKILFLNSDFPLSFKVNEVTAHEIAHAHFQNQASKNGSFLDGSATALAGSKLPVGAGAKAYQKYLRFDELWAHLISLRIQFQIFERGPSSDSIALGELVASARYTQNLYKAAAQIYTEALANEGTWRVQAIDADISNLEVATKTFKFSFCYPNQKDPKGLLNEAQAAIVKAQGISDSLLRSLQKLQRSQSSWTKEKRQSALNEISAAISELRKTARPLAFPH